MIWILLYPVVGFIFSYAYWKKLLRYKCGNVEFAILTLLWPLMLVMAALAGFVSMMEPIDE